MQIKAFDLAGQEKMRNVWKYYYSSIEGIIFVIDSSNKERIHEARDELLSMLHNEETKHIPIVVFANKQDLAGAVRVEEIIDIL